MRYKNGIPDYASVTPEEAATDLAALPTVLEAAIASHDDWGGDFEAHLRAHQAHRDQLTTIAASADNNRADNKC